MTIQRSAIAITLVSIILCMFSFDFLSAQPTDGKTPAKVNEASLNASYQREIKPLLIRYCHECHAGDRIEAEIDLSTFGSLDEVRRGIDSWQRVAEMLESGQMPPRNSEQPTTGERTALETWIKAALRLEALAHATDPGPTLLRRLNNAEYTYTLQDLTGLKNLAPAREFPVDSAAGEGFTNVGNALVMSPAFLTKYLDAGKAVAEHMILLPGRIEFSQHTTSRDRTNEYLSRIRSFYSRYSTSRGSSSVNLQGVQFQTNEGGSLPIEQYLAASLAVRDSQLERATAIDQVATERGLSTRYLTTLCSALDTVPDNTPSVIFRPLKTAWSAANANSIESLAAVLQQWQNALWKFNAVGQVGLANGPTRWMEPVTPLLSQQEMRLKLSDAATAGEFTVTLAASDAGDGNTGDYVVWERPRLVAPGRPDILLRDVHRIADELNRLRPLLFTEAAACLNAAAEAAQERGTIDLTALSKRHSVREETLATWLDFLGITGTVRLGTPISRTATGLAGFEFVKAWVGDDALSVVANSSDQHVRIPGNMRAHGIAVHPSPTLAVGIGWVSPTKTLVSVRGMVQHAHPECGNGVSWSVEVRRGNTRQRLSAGISHGATEVPFSAPEQIAVNPGDAVTLLIDPRNNNHSCDLTAVELVVATAERTWSLAADVSPDLLSGNPHADSFGNSAVWTFFSEPVSGAVIDGLPADSLLSRWRVETNSEEKQRHAIALQKLLTDGPAAESPDSPDAKLYRAMTEPGSPLLAAALKRIVADTAAASNQLTDSTRPGALQFGIHPLGNAIDPASLCVQAPSSLALNLPAIVAQGCDVVTTGSLHRETGDSGSVRLSATVNAPSADAGIATPIVAVENGTAWQRLVREFEHCRNLFPPRLCYAQIVPVDEVITLTLFYREDEPLVRLMLTEQDAAELDQLWDELLYVATEPLARVVAFEQISEFATQDRPDIVVALAPMKQAILKRASKFRERIAADEQPQFDSLLRFARRLFRRPLSESELRGLRALYKSLRSDELSHAAAMQLILARMLIAPQFLYKTETPGETADPAKVSDYEIATRLSYFLWSSAPDEELLQLAEAGKLQDPDTLVLQSRRMIRDPRARRLAIEFGCHWLHIYDFENLNEKSERHFPTFNGLRGAMYEESIQFLTHLFQSDDSLLSVLDADYTFLNQSLAEHYGIPNVVGDDWKRVDSVRQFHRGGVLAQASTLAKQSGASRTSPILRGNWLSEVVLGEKLPRPPKDVPQLGETAPQGLTERQMIEQHSANASCAKCHARIDPFGFSLENYDAIGRHRTTDAGGLAIDSGTTLPDGTHLDGIDGLRQYLLTTRRDAFLRQFCKKLLGFAVGRSVRLSDELLLEEMQQSLKDNGYRVSAAVECIVRSRPFRQIRGRQFQDNQ